MEPFIMVAEQIRFLRQHGYWDFLKNNEESVIDFRDSLLYSLYDLTRQGEINANTPLEDYELPNLVEEVDAFLIGKVTPDAQDLLLNIRYELDTENWQLTVKALNACVNGTVLTMDIPDPAEFPGPDKIYSFLDLLSVAERQKEQERYQLKKEDVISTSMELLIKKGYTEATLINNQKAGALRKQMEKKVAKALENTGGKKFIHFTLNTKGYLPGNERPFEFRVHYRINPLGPLLQPKAITWLYDGKVNNTRCSSANFFPSTTQLQSVTNGETKLLRSLQLFNTPVSRKAQRVKF